MTEKDKQANRAAVVCMAMAVTIFVGLVVLSIDFPSDCEYGGRWRARGETLATAPLLAVWHYHMYSWSWLLVAVSALWGGILAYRPSRSVLAVVAYVGVLMNLATAWFLFTLLVFYGEYLDAAGW